MLRPGASRPKTALVLGERRAGARPTCNVWADRSDAILDDGNFSGLFFPLTPASIYLSAILFKRLSCLSLCEAV